MASWQPDIFEFVDYRAYLRAYYEAAKKHTVAFSYRYFARKAGYASPSFLRHVMRGERNLSEDSIERFAEALNLNEEATEFFRILVIFEQTENPSERRRVFETIAASRRWRQARRLDGGYFSYLSHWYYPAIREMAARKDFCDDPAWIARQLLPEIPEESAREALDVLLDLGLLVRDSRGRVVRGDPTISTGHEVRSMGIVNYHLQMLERAGASMEAVPSARRDLGALTACISRQTVDEVKARIHEFRELILEICDRDDHPEVVYQFNTQFFPMSASSASTEEEP